MSLEMLRLIRNELSAVEQKLQSRSPIMRETDPVGSLDLTPLERQVRPGLILLGTRLFNYMSDKIVGLAGMVQFIHLAGLVHGKVRESETDGGKNASSMPVLLGDYFYGRFFALASDCGMTGLIRPLSEIVCLAAESSIRELRGEAEMNVPDLVHDQTAALFAEGMSLGSELAGASPDEQAAVRGFGLKLGMGYGLIGRGMSAEAADYGAGALAELDKLPDGLPRRALQDVVQYIFSSPARRSEAVEGIKA